MTNPASVTVPDGVTVVTHPLVQHKLGLMRDRETGTAVFRQLVNEVAMFLGYEATRTLELENVRVMTPMSGVDVPRLLGKKLVFASILRAGEGLLQGMIDLVPVARVAHVGLYRDPETLSAVEYYFKAPDDLQERKVIVLDPMLATGNSAIAALDRLKEAGATEMVFVCLLAAPEGVANLREHHEDVPIITAAIDEGLDDHGYIVPGLGDAGDRMFGTR